MQSGGLTSFLSPRVQYAIVLLLSFVMCVPLVVLVAWEYLRSACCRSKPSADSASSPAPPVDSEEPIPSVMLDPIHGEHGWIVANGIRFHYVAAGAEDSPLMLCIHGFPECWYTWRHQLASFRGSYRVVAVDMRGYGETSRSSPSFTSALDYSLPRLVEDVRSLIEAFGKKSCTLQGHDWGGAVAWAFAYRHGREYLDNLVILNAPHPIAYAQTLTLSQLARSAYIMLFQMPIFPEIFIKRRGMRQFLEDVMRSESMGIRNKTRSVGGSGSSTSRSSTSTSGMATTTTAISPMAKKRTGRSSSSSSSSHNRGGEEEDAGAVVENLSEEDMDAFTWAMSRAGTLTAALNYYRCLFTEANSKLAADSGVYAGGPKLTVRTLLIWGEEDGALGADSPRITGRYCEDMTLEMIPGASHWVQQDAVEEVNRALAAFLLGGSSGKTGDKKKKAI
jgi:pimeloyl-ACP methyl ester carboxylesterase